jgi:hypothetical protein
MKKTNILLILLAFLVSCSNYCKPLTQRQVESEVLSNLDVYHKFIFTKAGCSPISNKIIFNPSSCSYEVEFYCTNTKSPYKAIVRSN